MLDSLPLIEYWGARRIDEAISKDAVGGALLGILVGAPLMRVPTVTAQLGRSQGGLLGSNVGWAIGWAVSAYIALLLIAHWKDVTST